MRALLYLPLLAACTASPPDSLDLAPQFFEPLHTFSFLTPALMLADDHFDAAGLDLEQGVLWLQPGGQFTSGWLTWERPFDEVLASWNATVPAGTGLVIEVQVGDREHASPWLYLGDWGIGAPLAEGLIAYSGGKVAVDVLQLERPMNRTRLRLTATGTGSERVRVHRTALCLTDRRRLHDLDPGAHAGPVALDVPARSQRVEEASLASRICSPTSVAMVLEAHGVALPTAEVAALLYDADHDLYGNWPRSVQGAFTLGVPGTLVRLSSWRAVEHFLRNGVPLVISIGADEGELRGAPYPRTSGHLLVIRGLTADGDVLVNDPAAPTVDGVPRTYHREDLEGCWMRRGGVAYAIGQ